MEKIVNWFNTNCDDANFNRLGLLAVVLLVQTCILVPITVLSISFGGSSVVEVTLIAAFSFAVLGSLLGDLPAKIVIPLFIISTLVHLLVIVTNVI